MRLPWIVRQIGNASGKDRIYIEDYACSFLENCKKEESLLPVRAALYGYALQKGESHIYLIYGVSHIAAELQQGMSQEQIREMFFSEYELIGYVNLYAGQTLFKNPASQDSSGKSGFFIFYENNEAMQDYMIFCNKRKQRMQENHRSGVKEDKHLGVKGESSRRQGKWTGFFSIFLLAVLILLTATASLAIGDYAAMREFALMAAKALQGAG